MACVSDFCLANLSEKSKSRAPTFSNDVDWDDRRSDMLSEIANICRAEWGSRNRLNFRSALKDLYFLQEF